MTAVGTRLGWERSSALAIVKSEWDLELVNMELIKIY